MFVTKSGIDTSMRAQYYTTYLYVYIYIDIYSKTVANLKESKGILKCSIARLLNILYIPKDFATKTIYKYVQNQPLITLNLVSQSDRC